MFSSKRSRSHAVVYTACTANTAIGCCTVGRDAGLTTRNCVWMVTLTSRTLH